MVKYIKRGDIFKLEGVNSYAHGCNCSGAMGKGIALQFKIKYPRMYKDYKLLCKQGHFFLGEVFHYNYGEGIIFNLGTQKHWRTKAELDAIELSIKKMIEIALDIGIKKIAMPAIGSGLGGLEWKEVKRIINKIAGNISGIELIVVEKFNSN